MVRKKKPADGSTEDVTETAVTESDDTAPAPEPAAGDVDQPVVLEEPVAEVQPERQTPPPERADTAPASSPAAGPGLVAMFLGGICAAAVGFGASQYLGNDGWPFGSGQSQTETLLQEQTQRLSGLEASLAGFEQALDDNRQLATEVASLKDAQQKLAEEIAAAAAQATEDAQRLSDLENRPIPEVGATREAVAAYEEQLAGMRQMFQAELARIEAAQDSATELQTTAAETAASAALRAAIARLRVAVDSGAPYSEALAEIEAAGVQVDDALRRDAAEGVPTLALLQSRFPDAARLALQASVRAQADQGEIDRVTAFLKSQLGTRSLQPRDGTDADAVLSRAEAALRGGDLDAALAELAVLPEAGAQVLADWTALAGRRQEAVAAANALSAEPNN